MDWSYTVPDAAFVKKLLEIVPDVHWNKDEQSKEIIGSFSHDASFHKWSEPDIVVFPKTANEAAQIMKLCFDNNVAVTPRGAGTGISPFYFIINFVRTGRRLYTLQWWCCHLYIQTPRNACRASKYDRSCWCWGSQKRFQQIFIPIWILVWA